MKKTERGARKRMFPGGTSVSRIDEEAQRAPIDEGSFKRYYDAAMKAASMTGPVPTVKDRVIPSLNETLENVVDIVFGDDPLSRMTIAIKNQMLEEKQMDKFSAVFSRMLALIELIGKEALKRWAISRPHDPRHLYYPDAVVFAAAVSPLNDDLTFQIDQFERLVKERMCGINPGRFVAFI